MDWNKVETKYGPHVMNLKIGKIHVATVSYNPAPRNTEEKYLCCVHLPGMRKEVTSTKHKTEDEAMSFAQAIVTKWILLAGLSSQ